MFLNNLQHELMAFRRDRWALLVIVLFFGLTFFALRNGEQMVVERQHAIDKELHLMDSLDTALAAEITAIEENRKAPPKESWLDPRSLWVLARDAPRVIAMQPQPLALVATGQSDLFPHVIKPKIYGESYRLGFSELANPVQLLFGTFDLAFVCIYLLPLLVLALSYNVLSSDKELGILSLTASQPVSLYRWLLQKLLVRFLLLGIIVTVAILAGLGLQGVSLIGNVASLLKLMVAVLVYMAFWFGVAFAVNLMGKPSGTNAITLVALWLGIVLFIPAIIAQTTTTLNPVPSRVNMIHEYREAQSEARENADKIMDAYYRDHPELAVQNESQENPYGFMFGYFASASVINKAVGPVLDAYNQALARQQAWVNQLKVLSPALLLQQVFSQTAGTTAAHYTDFRKQVIDFTEIWKDYFKPRMFAGESLRAEDIPQLPRYQYSARQVPDIYSELILVLSFFLLLVGGVSFLVYQAKKAQLVVA